MPNLTSEIQSLIPFLIFLAIFLFLMGIIQLFRQKATARDFIKKIQLAGRDSDSVIEPASDDAFADFDKGKSPLADVLAKVGQKLHPAKGEDHSQTSRLRFLRAGYRHPNVLAVFWGAKILSAFIFSVIIFLVRFNFLGAMNYQASMALTICFALFGFYLPDIWIKQKADKRREKILEALPDALDLMVICVEAGVGIDAAIQRVAQEIKFTSPELSDELNYTTFELRAGKARVDALRSMGLRTNLIEINNLVTLLVQTDKFGTSMANALRVYSDCYRTERYQKAEELAAKLPVKLLFPLVAFIFPVMFVVLLGPAAISIYKAFIAK
jgi:tight adherence protein C